MAPAVKKLAIRKLSIGLKNFEEMSETHECDYAGIDWIRGKHAVIRLRRPVRN